MKIATFAGGCFWGTQATFQKVVGVIDSEVGYTGGHKQNPTYPEVKTGDTGHAEAIRLQYDSEQISYQELLNIFFDTHDPTTLNRQGPDVGRQYRSAIFYHDDEQQAAAESTIEALEKSGKYSSAIVTEVIAAGDFYRAEEYHQNYFLKQGG